MIKAIVEIRNIKMPAYTCGSFSIGKAKQNKAQVSALVNAAIPLVKREPPLSIATRLSKPAKMIAIPEPVNHRVSVLACSGKAKLICINPKSIIR